MAAEIKTNAFCGLSKSEDFQKWLEATDKDLHKDLMTVVHTSKGCRANSNKMMDIYFELNQRGMEPHLITFLKRRFPWIIKESYIPTETIDPKVVKQKQQVKRMIATKDWKKLNKLKNLVESLNC